MDKFGPRSPRTYVGLAAALMLGGCVSQSAYDDLKAQNAQMQTQLNAANAQVARLRGAIKYTVNSDLLFPSGSWEISEAGKAVIARLASQLAPTQTAHLIVAGYTDNAPIGPSLQRKGINSNHELSLRRSESVREFLISTGVKPDLVSAQGFGEEDPVASNNTPQGRAQNRRVVLSLAEG